MRKLLISILVIIALASSSFALPFSDGFMDERDVSIRSRALGQTGVVSLTTPDAMFVNPASTSDVNESSIQFGGQFRKNYSENGFRINPIPSFNHVAVMFKPIHGKSILEGADLSFGLGLGRSVDQNFLWDMRYNSSNSVTGNANVGTIVLAAKSPMGSAIGLSIQKSLSGSYEDKVMTSWRRNSLPQTTIS